MPKLDPNPTVAKFRSCLNDYITAAKMGERFILRRYHTPLAEIGPVHEMPKKFRLNADRVRFTQARNDFPSITRATLRGRAIIVTKLTRGASTQPRKGRKFAVARDEKEIAAVWPVPQFAMAAESGPLLLRIVEIQQTVEDLRTSLVPLLRHFDESKILQDEIDEKRRIADNLQRAIDRLNSEKRTQVS